MGSGRVLITELVKWLLVVALGTFLTVEVLILHAGQDIAAERPETESAATVDGVTAKHFERQSRSIRQMSKNPLACLGSRAIRNSLTTTCVAHGSR